LKYPKSKIKNREIPPNAGAGRSSHKMTVSSERLAVSNKTQEKSHEKVIGLTLSALLLALCFSAEAQQAAKVPRIGYLSPASPSAIAARQEAFRQGLRELGYWEGKNILIEYRYAEGNMDWLPELAAELVRLKVDVIVTTSSAPTHAAKAATATIPIIMLQDNDPIGNGFVASLARPGGNITGLAALDPELSGKRMELLKETVPKLSRVAVFGDSTIPGSAKCTGGLMSYGASFTDMDRRALHTSTRFSKALTQQNCRYNSQLNSNWSLI
jgi:ABC transporter substrate binding protein